MNELQIDKSTRLVKRRYNRFAPFYDMVIARAPRSWWEMLWSKAEGNRILEVGVGTGKSFPFYPPDADITAIDFSVKMLARAHSKADRQDVKVRLLEMDVQDMDFEDSSFDCVVASLVFCSVPHPRLGFTEIRRVCKPGGKVLLLEHVRSEKRVLGRMMDFLNPLAFWALGDNFNRRTVEEVAASGLVIESVTELRAGIFKLIEARAPKAQ